MSSPTKEQVDRFVAHVAATRGPWYDASRRELHAFAVLSELGEYLEAIEQGQPREMVMLEAGDVLFHAVTLVGDDSPTLFEPVKQRETLVGLLRAADTVKKELAEGNRYNYGILCWVWLAVDFMARDDWSEVMALYERKKEIKRTVRELTDWQTKP